MLVNDVFRIEEDLFRVLWINVELDMLVLIRIDIGTVVPLVFTYSKWVGDNGAMIVPEQDPYEGLRLLMHPTSTQIDRRDNAWNVIKDFVHQEPEVYFKKTRVKMLKGASDTHGVSQRTLYNYLKSYWQKGKCLNALLPSYHKSGAPGQNRQAKDKVLGRPTDDSRKNYKLAEQDKKHFKAVLDRYYKNRKEVSLSWVYKKLLKEFYSSRDEQTGEYILSNSYPSESQFRYWSKKLLSKASVLRARKGNEVFDKDYRETLSTAASQVNGPGDIFEIDATLADVYLVSRANRNEIVGRPTLYIVTDVFSRMIVGFYVGFEHASWISACLALESVVEDKSLLCQKYGVSIQESEWPVSGLPQKILADGAELKSYSSDRLVSLFGIETLNAAPYRADWKGVVESKFRLIQQSFKPYVEGYVPHKFNPRLDSDYRLDATLDIDQFTQIVLELILSYNNTQWIDSYDRTAQMLADSVSPVPIELWRWGMAKKTGALRKVSVDSFRLGLLPVGRATTSRSGLSFRGLYYSAPELVAKGWFLNVQSKKVEVSYDPRSVSQVYIVNDNETIELRLTDRSRAFSGLSLYEYQQVKKVYRAEKNEQLHSHLSQYVQTDARIEAIIQDAKQQKRTQKSPLTKVEQLSGIASNREKERQEERKRTFKPTQSSGQAGGQPNEPKEHEQSKGQGFKSPNKISKLIKSRRETKGENDDEK